ncbi:serine hydrolase [Paludisphaera soli]|uniref:serine hydrolase n=1 Tax=Paludisphaera soli TaxID=2712865 RepID=UPI0013EE381D|nr:serine hydrolase [Paludisphaera soli]
MLVLMPNSPRGVHRPLRRAFWGLLIAALPAIHAEEPRTATAPPTFDRVVEGLAPGVRYGIDVFQVPQAGAEARSLRRQADMVLPTASAIKTAIMIELFAKFPDGLDAPAPGLDAILKDDHPAVAHFDAKGRDEIRAGLSGASVRRIGRVMLGSEGATNLVYNAASNAAIALLGGPDETTRLIHSRDPAFAPIVVRRYMLTDRKVRGDNESSAEGLAAVLRRLASREIPGLDAATVEACRTAVEVSDDPGRGRRRFKDGALDSSPITRVSTGWYERPDGPPIVYVVMLAQDDPGAVPPAESAAGLQEAARRIAEAAVDALRGPSTP